MLPLSTVTIMVVATFFWGFNFPLAHAVVATVPPMEAASVRFGIAALVLCGMSWAQGHSIPVFKHGVRLGMLGLIGIVGFNLLFFFAMQTTTAVNASLIMGSNPLVTAVLAVLVLGETLQRRHVIALPIAFIGVAVVVLGKGSALSLSMGDVMMIGANLSWAAYNVLAKRWMPGGSAVANTAVVMIYSSLIIGAVTLVLGTPMVMPDLLSGGEMITIALAGTVLAYLCYNHGIAALGAGRSALFMNLVPVWAMLTSAAMGAAPSLLQMAGGALVIASVIYATSAKPEAVKV